MLLLFIYYLLFTVCVMGITLLDERSYWKLIFLFGVYITFWLFIIQLISIVYADISILTYNAGGIR